MSGRSALPRAGIGDSALAEKEFGIKGEQLVKPLPETQQRPVRRARRYPFAASVDLTDLHSEIHIQERAIELSLYGFGVAATNPFSAGTRVQIRIAHEGDNFVALGRVIYALGDGEMGIAFTRVEQNGQIILEKWIGEQRGHK